MWRFSSRGLLGIASSREHSQCMPVQDSDTPAPSPHQSLALETGHRAGDAFARGAYQSGKLLLRDTDFLNRAAVRPLSMAFFQDRYCQTFPNVAECK